MSQENDLPTEEGGSVHGHDALRRYFERWSEAWDNFDFGPTEFLDAATMCSSASP